MNKRFTLYTVGLVSVNSESLLEIASEFSTDAEIIHLDRESGEVRVQFVSTASRAHIENMCDEFKKEIESNRGGRLTYNISATKL